MAWILKRSGAWFLTVAMCLLLVVACATSPKPDNPAIVAYALQQLKDGDRSGALVSLDARLRAVPGDRRAQFVRAAALVRLGRGAEAVEAFAAYAKAGGKAADLDLQWGQALLSVGRPKDAAVKLEAYRKAHPADGAANIAAGRANVALKQFDLAEQQFTTATADKATQSIALLLLAATQTGRGNDIAGRATFARLVALPPDAATVTIIRAAKAEQASKGTKP